MNLKLVIVHFVFFVLTQSPFCKFFFEYHSSCDPCQVLIFWTFELLVFGDFYSKAVKSSKKNFLRDGVSLEISVSILSYSISIATYLYEKNSFWTSLLQPPLLVHSRWLSFFVPASVSLRLDIFLITILSCQIPWDKQIYFWLYFQGIMFFQECQLVHGTYFLIL